MSSAGQWESNEIMEQEVNKVSKEVKINKTINRSWRSLSPAIAHVIISTLFNASCKPISPNPPFNAGGIVAFKPFIFRRVLSDL